MVKTNIQQLLFSKDLFILGNQAADLDSTVSACSLSALLDRINPSKQFSALIQGSPEDWMLKPEIKALFDRAGISGESFFYTDGLTERDYIPREVLLVDHNKIDMENIDLRIAGIVDHHKDQKFYPGLTLRDIRVCGSCASIISRYWEQSGIGLPYPQRLILAGAISVDTGNLNPEWGKTTELDSEQYNVLISGLSVEDKTFIHSLLEIKNDLSHLTLAEQLKRDYKKFPSDSLQGGIASVPLPVSDFFNPAFFNSTDIDSFARKNCPDFLIIMHTRAEPFQRELSLFIPPGKSGATAGTLLHDSLMSIKKAGFHPLPSGSLSNWTHFSQKNITVSRKVLVPLLLTEIEIRIVK